MELLDGLELSGGKEEEEGGVEEGELLIGRLKALRHNCQIRVKEFTSSLIIWLESKLIILKLDGCLYYIIIGLF